MEARLKKIVAKILKKWQAFLILVILLAAVILIGSYLLGSFIVQMNYEAEIQSYKSQITDLTLDLEQYSANTKAFVRIQNQYRTYTNDIVKLLYSKESYLGTGGSGDDLVIDDNITSIFLLRQAVENQQDNLFMMGQVKDYLVARKQFVESFPFIWPILISGVPEITSGYGVRMNDLHRPTDDGIHYHAGIDINGERGDDIVGTAKGRVYQVWDESTALGMHPTYGKLTILIHDYDFKTYYGHQEKIIVRIGQVIERGQKIGEMGDSGLSYGVHLHYEVRKDNIAVDPMNFLSTNY